MHIYFVSLYLVSFASDIVHASIIRTMAMAKQEVPSHSITLLITTCDVLVIDNYVHKKP